MDSFGKTLSGDSAGHSAPLYDLAMIHSVSGGDQAFVEKMIRLFIETVPANVGELRRAFEAAQWDQVGKLAHKLKSTIDSMGIKTLHGDIRALELHAKQQTELQTLGPCMEKVEETLSSCIRQLRDLLAA